MRGSKGCCCCPTASEERPTTAANRRVFMRMLRIRSKQGNSTGCKLQACDLAAKIPVRIGRDEKPHSRGPLDGSSGQAQILCHTGRGKVSSPPPQSFGILVLRRFRL